MKKALFFALLPLTLALLGFLRPVHAANPPARKDIPRNEVLSSSPHVRTQILAQKGELGRIIFFDNDIVGLECLGDGKIIRFDPPRSWFLEGNKKLLDGKVVRYIFEAVLVDGRARYTVHLGSDDPRVHALLNPD